MKKKIIISFGVIFSLLFSSTSWAGEISGELKKWHKITITFNGPETSENDEFNPFMNYRLNVIFQHKISGKTFVVPGYFAADGDAGETSAVSGNVWKVHFAPDEIGEWSYRVDFRKGLWLAVSERKDAGKSAGFMDGETGLFYIRESDKSGNDNRAKGRLVYDGTRYLKYAETGKPMLKTGVDSPENFLAYSEFDGSYQGDGHKDYLIKTWESHVKDWKKGDPVWQGSKGKGIIGAINYLASKGLNSFSFLTLSIKGDDQNVYPFINYDTYDRYDCSKLDQWEILFEHAEKLGMFLHFKILEQENQGLLDNGAIGARTKLLYRELIARFGHHLVMNWNCGEESGDWADEHVTPPMNTTQRLAAAEYFYQNDPYHHHVVIHCPPAFDDIVGPLSKYSGVSVQTGDVDFNEDHFKVKYYLKISKESGKQWAVSLDEPGDAAYALVPDDVNLNHDDARKNSLWSTFLAGGWGWEAYFGYKHNNSDLTCQDYRSRDTFWDQCRYLQEFFDKAEIDITLSDSYDNLVEEGDYCLANPGDYYIVFLKNGQGEINLKDAVGEFSVKWYNPRKGGDLLNDKVQFVSGGNLLKLVKTGSEKNMDWVVLLKRI